MSSPTRLYPLALFDWSSAAPRPRSFCAREYAPAGRTGLSIGVVMFFAWFGMALGGWQGGLFYDLCGSYRPSFANASLGGVANLLVLGLLYAVTVRRPRLALHAAA
jgi:hypothetical protein